MLYMNIIKRVNPKNSHHKEKYFFPIYKKFVSIWNDGYALNLLW